MKHLIAIFFIITSYVSSAQDSFIRNYTSYVMIENGVTKPSTDLATTVLFYPNDKNEIVFYYDNIESMTFYQVGDMEVGSTHGGYRFQLIKAFDFDNNIPIMLQLFDEYSILRIFISEGNSIEFYNRVKY